MNNIFCTLFDSHYLDKALVLYDSISHHCDDFRLYIFAFDDKSEKILLELSLSNAIIISLKEFEDEELLKIKDSRSAAEYCWTCTPSTIRYVFDHYDEKICTYIDADLYFFNNPDSLFKELEESDASVLLTKHLPYSKKKLDVGNYCVEFNTFRNDYNGNKALNWWKDKCLDWCYAIKEENRYGDQKYLDDLSILFEGIHTIKNIGAGVAPWNIYEYKLLSSDDLELSVNEKSFNIIFYHFASLNYLFMDRRVNLNLSYEISEQMIETIYYPYLIEIENKREFLKKKFNLDFNKQRGVYKNKLKAFLKSKIRIYYKRSPHSIVDLKKVRMFYEQRTS